MGFGGGVKLMSRSGVNAQVPRDVINSHHPEIPFPKTDDPNTGRTEASRRAGAPQITTDSGFVQHRGRQLTCLHLERNVPVLSPAETGCSFPTLDRAEGRCLKAQQLAPAHLVTFLRVEIRLGSMEVSEFCLCKAHALSHQDPNWTQREDASSCV